MNEKIMILDFGSQYTQLIARRVRELNVYSEVYPYDISLERIKQIAPKGIILSGGPASVYLEDALKIDPAIFNLNIPILGICYGMQLICDLYGGKVQTALKQEFGSAILHLSTSEEVLFNNVEDKKQVWMSHTDHVEQMPNDFIAIANSENSISAIKHKKLPIYGLQFHPEVTQSIYGNMILKNFVVKISSCKQTWQVGEFINNTCTKLKETIKQDKVILALSGGVDSTVCAVLLNQAIGKQLTCIFVDNGLLRNEDSMELMENIKNQFNLNIICVDAKQQFYTTLKGVSDPESKRKIIGKLFIDIFTQQALKINDVKYLAQGTIYSDVIESSCHNKVSSTIKSHHNVGGLPENLPFILVEPLKELFKDEVRKLGEKLNMAHHLVYRHPFPGPGLAIRIIGEVTEEKVKILQQVDHIFLTHLRNANVYYDVNQAFTVLLPVKSVGVMGDERTYGYTVVLRSVNSVDFMSATWSRLDYDLLEQISASIVSQVREVNRVVYDITSKPPSTIEWE